MEGQILEESELILNTDGSVYHLKLLPEHIADTVLLVGDQGRVPQISNHFNEITHQIQNREFVTHVGTYKGKKVTALSTGIGTDNIDIVLNELNAAANVDLQNRRFNQKLRSLNLIRIGTSGALQPDLPPGTRVVSEYGLGLDGVVYYYNFQQDAEEKKLNEAINLHLAFDERLSRPYLVKGSAELIEQVGHDMTRGITATATGFYGPQGRKLVLPLKNPSMNKQFQTFHHEGKRITNFEMETSALYGLGKMLGHRCCTCCLILANRDKKEYLNDHQAALDDLIVTVLDRI